MFGSAVLDVAIGLFLMYLLLSMIATVVQEAIANLLNLRSGNLFKGLTALLEDDAFPGLVEEIYKHPLVFRFINGDYKRTRLLFGLMSRDNGPSYIPSDTFIAALIDTLRKKVLNETDPLGFDALMTSSRRVVEALPPGPLKTNLMLLVGDAAATATEAVVDAAASELAHGLAEVRQVRKRLTQWFDETMDRVAGVYRRLSQAIAIAIGIIAAVALNADSIHVAVRLWQDAPLRTAIADSAAPLVETLAAEKAAGAGAVTALQGRLDQLQVFPIGWNQGEGRQDFVYAVAGWLLTGFAVSLGSSFWFNALGELLKLRASGPRVVTRTSAEAGGR